MEAIFQLMEYQKRDILDSIESTLTPYLSLALDSKLPNSITMFHTPLPPNNSAFQELVKKCHSVSTEFNLFTLNSDFNITYKFNFFQQYKTLQVIGFKQIGIIDLPVLQKKLSNLIFFYTIPHSHLSFAVQNTSYKFIYNSSYNEFVAHDATNYEQFISTYSVIPVPQLTNPQIPQPSGSTTTAPPPSTPMNPMASLYD